MYEGGFERDRERSWSILKNELAENQNQSRFIATVSVDLRNTNPFPSLQMYLQFWPVARIPARPLCRFLWPFLLRQRARSAADLMRHSGQAFIQRFGFGSRHVTHKPLSRSSAFCWANLPVPYEAWRGVFSSSSSPSSSSCSSWSPSTCSSSSPSSYSPPSTSP